LQPYDGANYLPPSEEWGKPGFLKAARAALDTWQAGPDRAHALASEALEMMKLPPLDLKARLDIPAKLVAATKAWVAAADSVNGGFGSAPKQPEPELIRFLLTRDKAAQEVAIKAARALVSGALRDPVDGGFYRRCIDEAWKEPYFQKTLVDQARIALALFEAADAAKDEKLRAAGIGALEFVLKELRNPDGTFAAALDGTLEENADPAKRPKFAKVGSATSAALGLFFSACRLSGAKHLVEAASGLAGRLPGGNPRNFTLAHAFRSGSPPTAADYLGAVLAVRVAAEGELLKGVMGDMLALAKDLYFDAATGTYMASRSQLAPGIAARVPAPADALSAEVLALLAAVDAKTADLIRRNLMNQIEYDELPPGDILLGLSQGQK
ncbi:MAG TPA: hypothetical protein VG734_08820, partial [Lacunisphaera sp.]|nr:hypothetical protein [Lacunisphaera sp.]